MPKHKKTREQKKRADAKHALHVTSSAPTVPSGTPLYSFSSGKFIEKKEMASEQPHNTLAAVRHDLFKTLWISLAIIALQILFYILLRNHVLAINFVRY